MRQADFSLLTSLMAATALTVFGGCGQDAAETPAPEGATAQIEDNHDHGGGAQDAHAAESGGNAGGSGVFSGSDTLWNFSGDLGEPVAVFGETDSRWTQTTHGAANRGTTGEPATIIGEVVDVSCYMQLGKRGAAHIPCGTNCVQNGAPIGLVDANNELTIVMAEEHDPRRYGNVALKEAMLPFMAKTVEATGMLTRRDGVSTLYVLGYTMGDNPNQPKGN